MLGLCNGGGGRAARAAPPQCRRAGQGRAGLGAPRAAGTGPAAALGPRSRPPPAAVCAPRAACEWQRRQPPSPACSALPAAGGGGGGLASCALCRSPSPRQSEPQRQQPGSPSHGSVRAAHGGRSSHEPPTNPYNSPLNGHRRQPALPPGSTAPTAHPQLQPPPRRPARAQTPPPPPPGPRSPARRRRPVLTMGVQGFQDYIEKHCPSAVVPVELQKLARGSLVGGGRQRPPQTPLRLLIDADNCLHRLYGGFYTDWVSGGQWNHMLGYLAALAKACFNGNIELFVFFNGALEKARLHEWVKRQGNERQTAQQIVSHVQNKGTPPPKVWFLPPVCMAHCIRLALIRFHIKVRRRRAQRPESTPRASPRGTPAPPPRCRSKMAAGAAPGLAREGRRRRRSGGCTQPLPSAPQNVVEARGGGPSFGGRNPRGIWLFYSAAGRPAGPAQASAGPAGRPAAPCASRIEARPSSREGFFFASMFFRGRRSVDSKCPFLPRAFPPPPPLGSGGRAGTSVPQVAQSIEDHHQEVIAFCREKGFHGLVAYDSDYALCNIPYYFSAHALKLSRNGKSLTTSQYLMHEVAKQLDLNPNRFPIFAALLGNHILPDEDLASFHWSLLGPEHPLASLKVRAHQLVLPPCDVVIKAVADYVRNIQDTTDLDAIAKDVFQHSQSRTDDKVTRFKRAVAYYSATNKPMPFHPPHYLGRIEMCSNERYKELREAARPNQFGMPGIVPPYVPSQMLNIPQTSLQAKPVAQQMSNQGGAQGQGPYPYSLSEPAITLETGGKSLSEQNNYSNIPHEGKHTPLYERSSPINPAQSGSPNHVDSTYFPASSTSSSSDNDEGNGSAVNHVSGNKIGWEKTGAQSESQTRGELGDQTKAEGSSSASSGSQAADVKGNQTSNPQIPCLLSMPTRNHMDITTPPLPPVAPEVLRVAEHRHKKGLMYPYIFHVLTKGEIKIAVSIEDEANKDLPPAALLYRPVRQYVYGVLFSLAESRKKTERLAFRKNRLPPEFSPVIIKEWAAYKGKSPQTPELVEALAFREWTCPNLKKLWLGKAVEDKNRRMRAFLACMRSDTPAMLNPTNVPTHLMVLCCVLRYMVQWPGVRILRRQELDAFLAQALSPKLYEPDQLQELKIENLDPRGIQLSALFMSGVDMALFANDACGQPIPWEHCCPWMYFDGKLFQTKLIKASREKVPLIDLCDGQAEQAAKVEKMRQSILEGLNFSRQNHPLPFPPPPAMPFYPASMYPRHFGPVPPPQGRGRGFAGVYGFGGPYGETVATGAYRAFRVAAAAGHSGAFSGNDSNRTSKFQGGVQPIPSQGGKLEIAGTVVGHWAGSRRGRGGRGPFPLQVVSVGGPARGRPRGVISTPVIRTFGRGGRYYGRGYKSQGAIQGKPPYAASAEEVAKELKSKSEESKSSIVSSDGSLAENGVVNEEKPASQMNGNTGDIRASNQSESALSNDSKMCNTNPHLNALNADSVCHKDDTLEATVLKKEE
ncbi:constitutive coactivator of PPAR-gamma-like protein 1 isoform 5-T5 [Alca torda]